MNRKNMLFVVISSLGLWAFLTSFRWTLPFIGPSLATNESGFLAYVIPKLSVFTPRFSLRDRTFVDLRSLPPKTNAADKGAKIPPSAPAPVAVMAPPTKPLKKETAPTKEALSPSLDVTVVNGDGDAKKPLSANENNFGGGGSPYGNVAANKGENEKNDWLQKIYLNPSRTTMNEFIDAFASGQFEAPVYFQILGELLQDRSSDIQKLGLYALSANPNSESLALFLIHQKDLSPETQTFQKIFLDSFIAPEKIPTITQTLGHANEVVVLGALPLALNVGQEINTWLADLNIDNDDSRNTLESPPEEGALGQRPVTRNKGSKNPARVKLRTDYKNLLTQLKNLSLEGNSLVAGQAESVRSQMAPQDFGFASTSN